MEGFTKSDFEDRGFIKVSNMYSLRIHELIWIEIDQSGFATLKRKRERKNNLPVYYRITIPKPLRKVEDLDNLLSVLSH